MIIAVDGFSSTGKSTIAKKIASQLGIIHVDTGAMYRAVTLYALNHNLIADEHVDAEKLIADLDKLKLHFAKNAQTSANDIYLNGQNVENDIRGMHVSDKVSAVAKIPEVRHFLVDQQRKMGEELDLVMDGRDIGTVVFPHADLKLFVTADPQVRAQRRYDELKNLGVDVSLEEVQENIESRDYQDSTRAESPLKRADDAVVVNNTDYTPEETLQHVLQILKDRNIYPKSSDSRTH
ncbi:MAG: (d)CMP kinase [Weeksellaceae bacterium]|nr:(d)CMP kinase [Weeksellaceae bacterium]